MLNGRIPPSGMVEGFSLDIGASGSFFPTHVKLPVMAYFFRLTEDNSKPSPYLGHVDLTGLSNKRGYHVPRKGCIQVGFVSTPKLLIWLISTSKIFRSPYLDIFFIIKVNCYGNNLSIRRLCLIACE